MHDEALLWTRQTLGYPTPVLEADRADGTGEGGQPGEPALGEPPVCGDPRERLRPHAGPLLGDAEMPGGRFLLGSRPLPPHEPIVHVCWHEANAYCRWAGRRLPTEAEWEFAASMRPAASGALVKARYPWGDEPPRARHANLDGFALGCVDVAAHATGDNAFGVRQLIGNVWEWTQDTFGPYPGFAPDAYREYSEPLFGATKVLRGGAWTTRARLITATYRNFFGADRRDVFAGFRTCSSD